MGASIIDTNLLIRFFTGDDLKKAEAVKDLLSGLSGKVFIPDVVFAECIWVMQSVYNLDKSTISEKLTPIIESPGVLTGKEVMSLALMIWVKENIDYIDAYILAIASEIGADKLYTYDKKLAKSAEIEVSEP